MSYQVVHADWAAPSDVVALEHVHDNGLCLVYSTTLPLSTEEIAALSAAHEEVCSKA